MFVIWFVSGIVLMYASYPSLTIRDRLAHFPALVCGNCIGPAELARAVPSAATSPVLRLGMRGDRAVWRFLDGNFQWIAADAVTGHLLPASDSVTAASIALAWLSAGDAPTTDSIRAVFGGVLDAPDQWTLLNSVDAEFPLLRFDLTDASATRVYVAQRSGEVLAASTRRERALAWIGAIPHWIFPAMLRRHETAWSRVVISVSALGTLMSVAGLALGLGQWRGRRTQKGERRSPSPYRSFVLRWHHLLGLTFGIVVCTWVFSGLLSMNPGRWSPGIGATRAQRLLWVGGERAIDQFTVTPDSALRALHAAGRAPRELLVSQIAGQPWFTAWDADGSTRLVRGNVDANVTELLDSRSMMAMAPSLVPGAGIVDTATLVRYDNYYRDPRGHLTLPVIRVRYNDAAGTWLYLDPRLGGISQRMQSRSRLERWLYVGLHDFDVGGLAGLRPLWDVIVITFSLGGLLCAVTGCVIAVRWSAARLSGTHSPR
jgi:PepSY-associated TM region